MSDMASVIVPKSDQLNADDLIAGPITITITKVSVAGGAEQPVSVFYDGDRGKPYKPCKSMCRVMVQGWGRDSAAYAGRSMTLYRDPKVKWGGMEVGGIRISHMSDIEGQITMALTETKGKRSMFTARPLERIAPPTLDSAVGASAFLDALAAALASATTAAERDVVLAHQRVQAAGSGLKNGNLTRYNDLIAAALARFQDEPPADDDGWPGPRAGDAP